MDELTKANTSYSFSIQGPNDFAALEHFSGRTTAIRNKSILTNDIDPGDLVSKLQYFQRVLVEHNYKSKPLLFPQKSKHIEIIETLPNMFEVRTPTGQATYGTEYHASKGYNYRDVIIAISEIYDDIILLNEHGATANIFIHNTLYNLFIIQSANFQLVASWNHLISNVLRGVLVNGTPIPAVCIYPDKLQGRVIITDMQYRQLASVPYDSSAILIFRQIPGMLTNIEFRPGNPIGGMDE